MIREALEICFFFAENGSPIGQLYAAFAALFLPYKQNIASVKTKFSKATRISFEGDFSFIQNNHNRDVCVPDCGPKCRLMGPLLAVQFPAYDDMHTISLNEKLSGPPQFWTGRDR